MSIDKNNTTSGELDDDTIHALCDEAHAADDVDTVALCYLALGYHNRIAWMQATPSEIARAKARIANHLASVRALENT